MNDAKLILDNGVIFYGKSFGYEGDTSGEVVFNTAMTGYPESLTETGYMSKHSLLLTIATSIPIGMPRTLWHHG